MVCRLLTIWSDEDPGSYPDEAEGARVSLATLAGPEDPIYDAGTFIRGARLLVEDADDLLGEELGRWGELTSLVCWGDLDEVLRDAQAEDSDEEDQADDKTP
jgi:hypothetical protein